ncbi:CAR1 transcription factor isoform X2 [Anopheles stephensi]|uniref:CAR1 transcription factor isoform X2 n=1 Tax=Anopheles stephensi TaxID=30069 RepID=UPI0016588BD6|nr:CAR1 transcription factor isoform X2 [Anopheles stephensi]
MRSVIFCHKKCSVRIPLSKVWFQNRRAKWRKQARLQLLQDAWRMRCLSMGNAQLIIASESQTPNNSTSNSSNNNNNNNNNNGAIKTVINSNASQIAVPLENVQETSFIPQPAFQNRERSSEANSSATHANRHKSNGVESTIAKECVDKNSLSSHKPDQLAFDHNHVMHTDSKIHKGSNIKEYRATRQPLHLEMSLSNSSDTSSNSEEIDLTSNIGCIDYSSSNTGKP